MSTAERILIIDFGSQYAQLIARRVREIGVYCEMVSYHASDEMIDAFSPNGIILSGGPESVLGHASPRAPQRVFTYGCPILGICYGMQTMAEQLGGAVQSSHKREFGHANVLLTHDVPLFADIADSSLAVWMSHGDQVSSLPPSFKSIASTDNCEIAVMYDETRQFYGLQFHPEVSHTPLGKAILEKFLITICRCQKTWTTNNIIEEQIHAIQKQVGQDTVLLGLSGGVDSSVAALLLHQAIGKQLICMFVDTGLLRLNEIDHIKNIFEKNYAIHLVYVEAKNYFYQALKGIEDPEEKRKVIGKTFINVFEKEANKLGNIKWLAQGTIYSDVIESAAAKFKGAHVIKSHHNVGGLPTHMNFKLVEPLRELFKDEVRHIGKALGLPKELLHRHPFPGPGLGVRILGEVKEIYLEKLRLADAILIEELHRFDLYYQVSQAFAVFLPVKSVGVIGDARHYDHVIAIRIVETTDFMTAHWARVPYECLASISNRIINEVAGISRVTYDISGKPPATIEWE